MEKMFCNQCQEAAGGIGCTIKGVCGKESGTANVMDTLIGVTKGVCLLNNELRKKGQSSAKANTAMVDALFSTITNANFDSKSIESRITKMIALKNTLKEQCLQQGISLPDMLEISYEKTPENYEADGHLFSLKNEINEDIKSLKELVLFGVKGMAAYAEHAYNLGYEQEDIYAFMQKALAEILRKDIDVNSLIALVLETGKYGVSTMALLDQANTHAYGNPEITTVNIGVRQNPAILISGHDLKDMEELLQQTEGTGVDIYTHSEMLPANYYPAFKKYKHFVGNYGNAWWKQREEFASFNGPILFTTNCIVPPFENADYKDRIYTTGSAGFPGCTHIPARENGKAKDFTSIIEHAKRCAAPTAIEKGTIVGGFAHEQVFALADKVIEAVKNGSIRKFVVMAGCDGRMKNRSYYTEFAQQLEPDTVILTAGCAKYRYNKLNLGDINGIPRVLDAGQCNDSYSLAVIALKLKEVFGLEDINQLPIVYNIAWYEQKAVIVLLALLSLGVKNIHLGPTLPAFLSPNVTNVLVENFNIGGISTVENDIKNWM